MERDRRVALVHGRYRPSETRTGCVVGSSPGGAGVASSRGLAQPTGWIELAGADPGVHGVDDVRARSDPRSSPGTKKKMSPGSFPPLLGARPNRDTIGHRVRCGGCRDVLALGGGHRRRDPSRDDPPACAGLTRARAFGPSFHPSQSISLIYWREGVMIWREDSARNVRTDSRSNV